jgi:hypothetical protein
LSVIANTTPGDYSGPLIPGSPVVFSLKNNTGGVVHLPTLDIIFGQSNITHNFTSLPESNVELLAEVAINSPERRAPIGLTPTRSLDVDSNIVIGPGGNTIVAGVYELRANLEETTSVVGSVTFKYRSDWSVGSRYWSDTANSLGLYFGLEYGPLNTGLFASLADGNIVVGGPLSSYSGTRPGQRTSTGVDWRNLSDGDLITLYFYIDQPNNTAAVFYLDDLNTSPVKVCLFQSLSLLGNFPPTSSGYSQSRDEVSRTATFYFGHGGSASDILEVVNFSLYPYAPLAIQKSLASPNHDVKYLPDAPHIWEASSSILPTHQAINRWNEYELTGGNELSFFYLSGKYSSPYYAEIKKSSNIESFVGIARTEPRLADSDLSPSCLVESRMSGTASDLNGVETGMGISVEFFSTAVYLTFLDLGDVKTVGIRVGVSPDRSIRESYAVPKVGGGAPLVWGSGEEILEVDWTTLKLYRVTYENNRLQLYIEDVETPVLVATFSEGASLPANEVRTRIGIGHFSGPTKGTLNVERILYLNSYTSWERTYGYFGTQNDPGGEEVVSGALMLVAARKQAPEGLTKVARSYDGTTWEQITNAPFGWGEFFAAGSRLLYVDTLGSTNQMSYSLDDGDSWIPISDAPELNSVAYGNGVTVGINATGVYYSNDEGSNWYEVSEFSGKDLITFDGSVFIVVAGDGQVWTSTNGYQWIIGTNLPSLVSLGDWDSYWYSIATDSNGVVMATVSNAVVVSTDHAQSWTTKFLTDPEAWQCMVHNVGYARDYGFILGMEFYAYNDLPGLNMGSDDADRGGMGVSVDNGTNWSWAVVNPPAVFEDWDVSAHKGSGEAGYILATWRANHPDPVIHPNIEIHVNGEAVVTPLTTEYVPLVEAGYVPEAWFSGSSNISGPPAPEIEFPPSTVVQGQSGLVTINKPGFGPGAPPCYVSVEDGVFYNNGVFVEFRSRVIEYTNSVGTNLAPNVWLGEGITLFFSDTKGIFEFTRIHVGFFDCGNYGRKIGIIPGNGTVDDIIRQTDLGRTYSATADWMSFNTYRLIYIPMSRVEVWEIGDNSNHPIISIPWESFTIESDSFLANIPAVAYGCINGEVSIKSEWAFVRYGQSSGYEVELAQDPTMYGKRELASIFGGVEVLLGEVSDISRHYHKLASIVEEATAFTAANASLAASSISTTIVETITGDMRVVGSTTVPTEASINSPVTPSDAVDSSIALHSEGLPVILPEPL